ncbi:MAG TPA: hypothetical protein VFQ53_33885 [Kofleriaceae bacterium]|nr:hypothetical protein [Kofleriaceae bacterium]
MIEGAVFVDGRWELERALGALLGLGEDATRPRTLDLIGHASSQGLLELGSFVIDASRSRATAFFRELADQEVLPRLGVTALRLLGCQTAQSALARATLRVLADILHVEVYGTTTMIEADHYDRDGFRDDHAHLLLGTRTIADATCAPLPVLVGVPSIRMLDLDAVPASPLSNHAPSWPRYVVTSSVAQELLGVIDRERGALMPNVKTEPMYELALPSTKRGWFHRMEVMLHGRFVRVFFDDRSPGVLFPVVDSRALDVIVGRSTAAAHHDRGPVAPHRIRFASDR